MARIRFLLGSGIFLFLLPFLGFPSSWENMFLVILGASIALTAFRMYKEQRLRKRKKNVREGGAPTFVENQPETIASAGSATDTSPINLSNESLASNQNATPEV